MPWELKEDGFRADEWAFLSSPAIVGKRKARENSFVRVEDASQSATPTESTLPPGGTPPSRKQSGILSNDDGRKTTHSETKDTLAKEMEG